MQFSTEFGDRLAGLRRSTGMTQDALASRLGVSAQAVSKWENSNTMVGFSETNKSGIFEEIDIK